MVQILIALITTLVIMSFPINKFNTIIDEIESEIQANNQYHLAQIDSIYHILNSFLIEDIRDNNHE